MYTLVFTYLCQTFQIMGKFGKGAITFTRDLSRRTRNIPGPKGWPLVGNLLDIDMNKIQHELTKWSHQYGKLFQFSLLGKKVVVISDAKLLEKALSSVSFSPHLNDRSDNITKHVYYGRKHIGLANWSQQTMTLRNVLKHRVLNGLAGTESFETNCAVVIDKFVAKLSQSSLQQDVEFDVFIKQFLTDINALVLMGETLPEGDKDQDALWELINHLYSLLDPKIDAPLRAMPFLRFLPIKHGRIFKDTIAARDRVSKRYFDTQKDSYEEGKIRGLVDVCLKIQQEERAQKGDSWLTDEYIKGLMYDTVVAGMSEMLKSIRMLILLMCHYEDIQSRVQTEIDDVIGLRASPSSSHRSEMPYTQAVILEMLRYVSQTPLAIPHKCNKDVVLDGYLIEKDAGIFPNIWGIHHDEEIWGDPWTFRPERFLNEEGQLLPKDNAVMKSLIPFSVGKRRCPGEEFAMTRLFLIFTSMLQKLNFRSPIDEELPSADPRLYSNMYPLLLPQYKCRALRRDPVPESSV